MSSLALTPRGHLLLGVTDDALLPSALVRRLESVFGRASGHGLLELGAGEVGTFFQVAGFVATSALPSPIAGPGHDDFDACFLQ